MIKVKYNRKSLSFLFIVISFTIIVSCSKKQATDNDHDFQLRKDILLIDNGFTSRNFIPDLYSKLSSYQLPEYVGNVYQIKVNDDIIYFNDTQSIYRFKDGQVEEVFTPSKGRGPKEVPQIFRFDIRYNDIIAIAGFPEHRLLLHQISTDTTALIETPYRLDVILDNLLNIYGVHTSDESNYMFKKMDTEGNKIALMGKLFNNLEMSMNMFNLYWHYNTQNDLIVVGFMYAGFIVVMKSSGEIKYVTHSIQRPGVYPKIVTAHNMSYVDSGGPDILRGLFTIADEIHINTAHALDKDNNIYGAVIDVIHLLTGQYLYSYILEEHIHWPFALLDDKTFVTITSDYNLVKWKRNEE